MNTEKLTIKAQEALHEALSGAQKNDHAQVETEHLLLALLRQENGIVAPIIEKIGGDVGRLTADVQGLVNQSSKIYGEAAQVVFSPALSKVLAKAEGEATALKDEFTSAEHLLITIAEGEGKCSGVSPVFMY